MTRSLVWKLDRFGRSALDLLTNLRQLDAAGVRFIALTQGIDIRPGGDAMSRLLLTMLSALVVFILGREIESGPGQADPRRGSTSRWLSKW